MIETVRQVQANQELAQASESVSALGGTKAGVYFLYGHPGCDWSFTPAATMHNACAEETRRI
eukprot:11636261-Prorocentrum_lima.AAC.1